MRMSAENENDLGGTGIRETELDSVLERKRPGMNLHLRIMQMEFPSRLGGVEV